MTPVLSKPVTNKISISYNAWEWQVCLDSIKDAIAIFKDIGTSQAMRTIEKLEKVYIKINGSEDGL